MKKVITVIGGSGFIGNRLCSRLIKDDSLCVRIFDKKSSNLLPDNTILGDVRDLHSLIEATKGSYALINLAAEHKDNVSPKYLYDQVNVDGAENCCKAADLNGISRIIFTSSVAVYGFARPNAGEDSAICPFNDYGRTKYKAEQVYTKWAQDKNKVLCIIRPAVVFGENNRGNVFRLFNQIARNHFIMVGNGRNTKSMAYVENVASFLEKCLLMSSGIHLYNYVDKPDLTVEELVFFSRSILGRPQNRLRLPYEIAIIIGHLADFLSKFSGMSLPVSAIRVKKFTAESSYSTRIHDDLFKAEVSLNEGIERTLRHEFISRHD